MVHGRVCECTYEIDSYLARVRLNNVCRVRGQKSRIYYNIVLSASGETSKRVIRGRLRQQLLLYVITTKHNIEYDII